MQCARKRPGFGSSQSPTVSRPGSRKRGHAPFASTVLGGLSTAVTCPILRDHPAVVAQAAATPALLGGDRLTLGLGSGERRNEHVVGAGRPGIAERRQRLAEALDIVKGLLSAASAAAGANICGSTMRAFSTGRSDRPRSSSAGPQAAQLAAKKGDRLAAT